MFLRKHVGISDINLQILILSERSPLFDGGGWVLVFVAGHLAPPFGQALNNCCPPQKARSKATRTPGVTALCMATVLSACSERV